MIVENVIEHMKATRDDRVRCVLETDEVVVLLDHLASFAPAPELAAELVAEEVVEVPAAKKAGKSK